MYMGLGSLGWKLSLGGNWSFRLCVISEAIHFRPFQDNFDAQARQSH